MAKGGAPAARARRLIEAGHGIVICPRLEDWSPREDKEPLGDEYEGSCAVCGHTVVVSSASEPFERAGWSVVCTYDAERFRQALGQPVTTPEIEQARAEITRRFAARKGRDADEVVQTLPPELRWLEELK